MPDDPVLLQKVLDYVKMEHIENESARQRSDREQAWLALLEADCINTINLSEHLKIAQQSKCYRVVEHLLGKQKSFDKILDCYLLDPHRNTEVWNYLQIHVHRPERKIFQQFFDHFDKLIEIDDVRTTHFVIDHFPKDIEKFVKRLDNNEHKLFIFLKNVLKSGISISSTNCELYLTLLSKNDFSYVETFLRSNDNYRLEKAIDIVKKCDLNDCLIYLYERQGDFDAAFNLSLNLLKESSESKSETRAFELSALCTRASEVLSNTDCEHLWFSLIKIVLSRSDLNSITKSILHAASSHVDLTKLVQIVLNSGTKTGNLGDIKHLLVGMLSNSKYEILLQQTTARIMGHDLHRMLAKEKKYANRGLPIKSIKCIVCRLQLCNQSEALIFGECGHASHRNCIHQMYSDSNKNIRCPRCDIEVNETEPIQLAQTNDRFFENNANDSFSLALQLAAPPRLIGS